MNESDIEFTVGLDTSPAEQKLNQFQSKMSMADAAFDRITSQNNKSYNVIRSSSDYKGFEFEKFNSYDNPLMNAAKKFEAVITVASEKLRLQNEKSSARREYASAFKNNDMAGMQTASQKFEQAQTGLDYISAKEKEERTKQREITDETKAQNREHNEAYLKLNKLHKLLLAILAAWQAIKKVTGAAFGRQSELIKETGFLTMDPTGAFHANTNRTYAMLMAGLRHMGSAAPFSMESVNSALTKIQTAKEMAMAGQGVDDNLTIAVQQLNDTLGTNFNAVQLLTGDPNRSNVEILKEILDTIESQLPKIAEMDEQTRSRTMHYIRSLIGPELANALMANLNLNLRTGENIALTDRVISHGGSSASNTNVAVATNNITSAGEELADAFDKVKDRFLMIIDGPLVDLLNKITTILDAFNAITENPQLFLPKPIADAFDAVKKTWEGASPTTKKIAKAFGMTTAAVSSGGTIPIIMLANDTRKAILNSPFQDTEDFNEFSKKMSSSDMDTLANDLYSKAKSAGDIFNAKYFASAIAKTPAGLKNLEELRKNVVLKSLFAAWKTNQLGKFEQGTTLGNLALKAAGFEGTQWSTYSEFEKWFEKKGGVKTLDKALKKGDEDIEAADVYNPWVYVSRGIPREVSPLESLLVDEITKEKTGGRYNAKFEQINGELHLVVEVYDPTKDKIIGKIDSSKPFNEVFSNGTK